MWMVSVFVGWKILNGFIGFVKLVFEFNIGVVKLVV